MHKKENLAAFIGGNVRSTFCNKLFDAARFLKSRCGVTFAREGLVEQSNPVLVGLHNIVVPLAGAHGKGGQACRLKALNQTLVAGIDEHHVGLESHQSFEIDFCALHDACIDAGHLGVQLL